MLTKRTNTQSLHTPRGHNKKSTTGADASVKVQYMKLLADLASLANCVVNSLLRNSPSMQSNDLDYPNQYGLMPQWFGV